MAGANAVAEGTPNRTTIHKVQTGFVTGVKEVVGFSLRLRAAFPLRSNDDLKLLDSDTLRVTCLCVGEYHAVFKWLESNKLQYHTFSLAKAKSLALVLRGLGKYLDPQDVVDAPRENGFPVLSAP